MNENTTQWSPVTKKKKRDPFEVIIWILGFVALIGLGIKMHDSGTFKSPPPAVNDIKRTSCTTKDDLVSYGIRFINHSNERSDYTVWVAIIAPNGDKVADAVVTTYNVAPGEIAREKGHTYVSTSASYFGCRLISVSRTPS